MVIKCANIRLIALRFRSRSTQQADTMEGSRKTEVRYRSSSNLCHLFLCLHTNVQFYHVIHIQGSEMETQKTES